jgi:hypothetical protein
MIFHRESLIGAAVLLSVMTPGVSRAQVDSSRVDTVRVDSLRADTVRVDSLAVDSLRLDSLRIYSPPRPPLGPRAADAHPRITLQSLVLVTSDAEDELRNEQLLHGVAAGKSLLLRSATSMTPPLPLSRHRFAVAPILPQFLVVSNSDMPFSQNNSAMWAGRGTSTRTVLGFRVALPHVSLVFAPQLIASDNQHWTIRQERYYQPEWPPGYEGGGYALPYIYYTFPIDQPLRFGDDRVRKFNWGESTLSLSANGFEAGVSNENNWWGPGIRNAMILSDNAPGFPHLFVRTSRPIRTPVGGAELRWLVGELRESPYFDTVTTNNVRSLSAVAVTVQTRWDPNLSLGFARSVYATARERGDIPGRFFDVFKRASRRNPDLLTEIWDGLPVPGGRDQLMSLFARWVFPKNGAEVYGEWGRTKIPASLAEFLQAPNHTQGYTLGMQWRSSGGIGGSVRLQAEVTQLEQSATFRDGPVGSWYTSSRVIQGYTNRGQVIGASIGPGASSQFVAVDYLKPSWRFGVFAGRIRWNEDVHSTYGFPNYVTYCSHDVSIYPGLRGALSGRFGSLSADFTAQNRMNVFFQNGGGCPNNGDRLDIRNGTLRIRLEPFSRH